MDGGSSIVSLIKGAFSKLITWHQGNAVRSSITPRDLECMLSDEMSEPTALPLSLLEQITNYFSDDQEIGNGGFAVVYKGKLPNNKIVAVKRLSIPYSYDEEFSREVQCLMMVKHKNIVRFLGYCADTQGSMEKYKGKYVMADVQKKLLCFEYFHRGCLHKYITDSSRGLRWRDRYQIITGICEGLHYLHQENIAHLDLKPANILLDDNLVAKIADFGLARCFDEQSRVISKIDGTYGYLAPECFNHTEVAYRDLYQLDIYSLGVVIMEILTGEKGNHNVQNIVASWRDKLERSQRDILVEQVQVCAEIGIECIASNPAKRPDTKHIINRLNKYIKTDVVTSEQVRLDQPMKLSDLNWLFGRKEDASNGMHQDMFTTPGETSAGKNNTAVTMAAKNPYKNSQNNNPKLDMLYETMHSLNPDIRRCLEYCSIFPKGYRLRRDDLICLWIAQGFVKTSCASGDIADIAGGYIQDLVSISFLEPIGSSSDSDCFTVQDVLYDILDKVGTCFRIENERSLSGEAWEGDVPRDVQHLFIQNYDGEFITGKILGLENLRTLIVYVVGKDTPIEEKVIESICKRLPKLRVLAIAFGKEHDLIEQPKEFSFPQSVGKLKYLRYLAFRAQLSCIITLPSTLNQLQHIQLLDFRDADISRFTLTELINLRHIFCWTNVKFPYVGRLSSLQTLPGFVVSNEQGCELKQLMNLNKLRGKLDISCLENVKSKGQAIEANLNAKEHITELALDWHDGDTGCSPEVEANVLEGLCPPVGLQKLEVQNFAGSRYPYWMVGKHSGGPKDLQELLLWECSQPVPASGLAEAFPHLRVLKIYYCNWDALPRNMEDLTSLKILWIYSCQNIHSLPTLPLSLEEFILDDCNDEFMESCQTTRHPNWQKIEHIPRKDFGDPATWE